MIKFLLHIRDFINQAVQSISTIFKVLLLSRPEKKLPKPAKQELVILGNGPSLKDFIKNRKQFLKEKSTMAVNHFAQTQAYTEIKPDYYMINAPEFWTQDVDEDVLVKRNLLIKTLIENTHWNMVLFLGMGAKKSSVWRNISKENVHIKIHYFNTTPVEGFDFFKFFCFKKACGMPRPHNVLIPSLIIAIRMKFKKIFITGADHSWMQELYVADDNTVYLTQKHFYDEQSAKPDVMKQMGKGKRKMHEILIKFVHAFSGYHTLDKFARKNHIKILNITPGSMIDAFERKKL